MNFINDVFEQVKICFNKYADFSGRATRKEYWSYSLVIYAVSLIFTTLSSSTDSTFFRLLGTLFSLATFVPGLAVSWRRLHDTGKSGSSYFFILIPIVGAIMLLVWFLRDSEPDANRFGPNPKAGDTVYDPERFY